jgi:hypothetical protein
MNTETLKISIAQRILSIGDDSILEKIDQLLNSKNIFAYGSDGMLVTEKDYINDLDRIIKEIDEGTAVLYTSKEVKKHIIDENNLV